MLENAPFSSGELDKAWKELCAFELEGRVWLPTAAALAEIWSSTISTATVRNLTLEDGFSVDMLEGALEEDGYPRALSRAILYRLRSNHEDLMDGCECAIARICGS